MYNDPRCPFDSLQIRVMFLTVVLIFLLGMYNHVHKRLRKMVGYVFRDISGVKLSSYVVIHNSQFIRSISCISSYMFRLMYRAIFRLVFGVV